MRVSKNAKHDKNAILTLVWELVRPLSTPSTGDVTVYTRVADQSVEMGLLLFLLITLEYKVLQSDWLHV